MLDALGTTKEKAIRETSSDCLKIGKLAPYVHDGGLEKGNMSR